MLNSCSFSNRNCEAIQSTTIHYITVTTRPPVAFRVLWLVRCREVYFSLGKSGMVAVTELLRGPGTLQSGVMSVPLRDSADLG